MIRKTSKAWEPNGKVDRNLVNSDTCQIERSRPKFGNDRVRASKAKSKRQTALSKLLRSGSRTRELYDGLSAALKAES